MLQLFNLKPFDLEPIYAAWPDAPVFDGKKPKKGRPDVDTWLSLIEAGCVQRKVPKNLWHEVAQHYMGEHATARFYEVKKVLIHLHGGRFTWDWKKYKTAMHNVCWDIDSKKTIALRVSKRIASGIWWIAGKKDKDPKVPPPVALNTEPFLTRTPKNFSVFKPASDTPPEKAAERPPPPSRSRFSMSKNTAEPANPQKSEKSEKSEKQDKPEKPNKRVAASTAPKGSIKGFVYTPKPTDPAAVERITHAPLWLLQTCISLDGLITEYPKTMSTLAAVLITVGSIPAIPAVSAGAAGAFLASGAAHAMGSVAMSLGAWIVAQSQGTIEIDASSTEKA